jgi:hypothetical protein
MTLKTFDEILQETAPAFLIDEFDVEQVTYTRSVRAQAVGLGVPTMAVGGSLGGLPTVLAVDGMLQAGSVADQERIISALVNRSPPEPVDGAPAGHGPRLTLAAANSAVTGISSSEVDISKDTVTLAVRIGETPQARRITNIISQDAGMMQLGIG